MASTLVNVALSNIKPPHASYYGDIDNSNPVVSAVNSEVKEVMAYFAKKLSGTVTSNEACSRGSNWLFDVWNKYEPRLPAYFFYNKLIEIGDYLREVGASEVASRQCYRRYLITRYDQDAYDLYGDPVRFRDVFFKSNEKFEDQVLTAKALLGLYMADYSSLSARDPGLLNVESVPQCIVILKGIQTFMQCLLVNESFCWMVYNCTIVIYSICRSLMMASYSIKAVDYLLWSAMCMESVVPLIGVKYLSWRVTLYSAICLAYYDCQASHHAEAFARRGLSKLQELSELERLSDSNYSVETQSIFRQATAKMASMIFKRTVYETRRKQKGYLRPKVRTNAKEMAQLSWPRTTTEKLLSDMFEGSAAQFLGILEALSSSHRRTFHNAPYSNESEMVEVTSELFFAGKEIIAGGGGLGNVTSTGGDQMILTAVKHHASLIDLAAAGEDGVTLESVVRFIKLAFCYDMWNIFDAMLDCTLIYIKKYAEEFTVKEQSKSHNGTELCLALMLVMQRVARSQSGKKMGSVSVLGVGDDEAAENLRSQGVSSTPSVQVNDDLINLAETVLYCISEPGVFQPQGLDREILIDKDMVMDASLLLWQKCKQVLGKQTATSKKDFGGALLKTGNPEKWLHILTVIHSSLLWCDVGLVDPALMADITLRLAVSLEAVALSDGFGLRQNDLTSTSRQSVYTTIEVTPNGHLARALSALKLGLKTISAGRANDSSNDARNVADVLWMNKADQLAECKISKSNAFIRDLVIEMLVVYYRVSFRLVDRNADKAPNTPHSRFTTPRTTPNKPNPTAGENLILTEKKIKDTVGSSYLCRAIFLMEKADQPGVSYSEAEKLLKLSLKALKDAEDEEKRIFEESWLQLNNPYQSEEQSDIPPPPILLSRSETSMIFKPASFSPERVKVAWYKIFGRLAAGPNAKVRLNDYYLPGTGDEVPAGNDCLLRVSGLRRNQRYLFAVAAYTSDGKLIGGSVGKTGSSIVASHPLSSLAVWGHLAHVSYKLGCLSLSKQACSVLWNIFVSSPNAPPSETWTSSARRDYSLTQYHLNREVAIDSSPVLLYHAVTAVFVAVETAIRENELYCDKFCEQGPLLQSQLLRMKECEKMLVAMEIAGWLNDSSLVLQAVVQTYGLLVPLIQAEIVTDPIMEVVMHCMSSLFEVRGLLKQKKFGNTADSLNHMVAVITNYLASGAKSKGNQQVALSAIDSGKTILRGDPPNVPGRKVSVEQHSGKKSRGKKGAALEPLSEKSVASLAELAVLEERVVEIGKDHRIPDEMTGSEDANLVITKLAKMRSLIGFREVAKFKRRNRFLEFFVVVLRKALRTMNVELAVECSQDVMTTLHRRNEGLAVNQAVVSKQPGGVAVAGEETRKYAAAVTEYSVDSKKMKKEAIKKEKSKNLSSKRKEKGNSNETSEEIEKKNAMMTLSNRLGKYYKRYLKKKKYRKILGDEYAYKSEFNMLNGLLHLQLFIDKIKERRMVRGYKQADSKNFNFLDQEWWSLDTSGAIIVGWNEGSRGNEFKFPKEDEKASGERALERAAYLVVLSSLVSDPKPQSPNQDEDKKIESPRSPPPRSLPSVMSQIHDPDAWVSLDLDTFLPCLKVGLLCFQRAMVLAHRGECWTLLQNTASALYSAAMTAYQVACDKTEPQFNLPECRELLRLPLTTAADLLIEMLIAIDKGQDNGTWLVRSIVGEPKEMKGGISLKFDKNVDDLGFINALLIKKVILQAIQILYHSERYEKLIDVCLRFTEVTHNCYYDVIQPLVIHAQAKLSERIVKFSDDSNQQSHLVEAAKKIGKTDIENEDYLRLQIKIKPNQGKAAVDVGGFIDPESHDVYEGGKRALSLSCVPFNFKLSIEKLKEAFHGSQYITRALQHSRKLLLIYLASQHNGGGTKRKGSSSNRAPDSTTASCVEFSFKADEPLSPTPPDLTKLDFTSTNTVEVLASPQGPTVVQSYLRTIELLESHEEFDLVSQASSELGNLYFHMDNSKTAFKWWKHSLDLVLGKKDSIHKWRKMIKDDDNTADELLATCGLWGSLHAITVACKIGEFTSPNCTVRSECALFSAHLVRSIFRSSMPHPTADFDYATYEILPSSLQTAVLTQSKTKVNLTSSHLLANCLITGIDFFTEAFRCDVQTVVASLHWLSDYLVQMKFYLQALPVLALYQYFATFVCRDVQKSVQCRLIKVTLLTRLRMFGEASEEMLNLLFGAKLPHTTDVSYAPSEPYQIQSMYDVTKTIDDPDNLRVMETIASKRLSTQLLTLYGPHLTCEVTLYQAELLVELASCIACIPQKPTLHDLQFVSPDIQPSPKRTAAAPSSLKSKKKSSMIQDDARSTISSFSTASTGKNVNKLFTKRERPMGLQLLKGMLLAVADNLLTTMIKTIESSLDTPVPSETWINVKSLLLVSEIQQQRQLSTSSAAKAVHAMNILQRVPLFDGKVEIKVKKPRSALRGRRREEEKQNESNEDNVEFYQAMEQNYRSRLNSRLWLDARLRLCQALTSQVKGLGKIQEGASQSTGLLDHSQVQLYCAEGLAEAEACNDVEMQAMFLVQGASLDGITSNESKHMLEDATSSLDEQAELSSRGVVALVEGTVLLADISLASGAMSAAESLQSYRSAHSVLLLKAMQEGETIKHFQLGSDLSMLGEAPTNRYSRNLELLAHIKLRIARAVTQTMDNERSSREQNIVSQVLEQADELCVNSAFSMPLLMAEINLELGKVQNLLFMANTSSMKSPLQALHKASSLAEETAGDLSLVKQAQLHLVILHLINIDQQTRAVTARLSSERARTSYTSIKGEAENTTSHRSLSLDYGVVSQPLEVTNSKQKIAEALHVAYHAACGIRQRSILPGDPKVTSIAFTPDDRSAMPDFLVLDLATDHTAFSHDPPVGEDSSNDQVVTSLKMSSHDVSWIHAFMYNVLLQRKSRLATSYARENPLDLIGRSEMGSDDTSQYEGRSICVRTPLKSNNLHIRLSALHHYLSRHSSYSSTTHIPPFTEEASFVAGQWHWTDDRSSLQFLWCVKNKDGTAECNRIVVNPKMHENVAQQVTNLKKRTDEYFARQEPQANTTPRRKSRSKSLQITPELEEDWKHVVNQIIDLLTNQEELINTLPFMITLQAANSIGDIFSVGCYFEANHPLHKWMSSLLCP